MNDLQWNQQPRAGNQLERAAFTGHLQIVMNWFCKCLVHASDVDLLTFLVPSPMIVPVDSHVMTEIDAMDPIHLSTWTGGCTIQLLCHMLFSAYFPIQLPINVLVYIGSGVFVRWGFWGCIVTWLEVSSCGGVLGLSSKVRVCVHSLMECHWVVLTEVKPSWLGQIPACKIFSPII
jgi:hypothetical protein